MKKTYTGKLSADLVLLSPGQRDEAIRQVKDELLMAATADGAGRMGVFTIERNCVDDTVTVTLDVEIPDPC